MPHKLLLADDSVTIQRVIELTFADEDVQVVAVGDGKQAIARLAVRPSRHRAGRRRDAGARRLRGRRSSSRALREFAHIPVVLLTGAFEPVDEARAQAVGCDGVLVKPFEPQMVINRVKDLLAGRRPQGLWSGTPGAASAAQADPSRHGRREADFDLQRRAAGTAGGRLAGSLEDYFDRLDAAFASLDGGSPSSPSRPRRSGGAAAVPRRHRSRRRPPRLRRRALRHEHVVPDRRPGRLGSRI